MTIKQMGRVLIASGLLMWAFDTQAADPQAGKALYNRQCANCHGSNGMPQLPGLPDFTRSEGLLRADTELKSAIQAGKGMMPAFRGLLTETQILDVIAYLRTLHR